MRSDATTGVNQDAAKVYCNDLSLAGSSNWHLPTRTEFRAITRYNTSSGSCTTGPCPTAQGPGQGGCYWPIEMGTCTNQLWTTDAAFAWIVQEAVMTMAIPSATNYRVRCVAPAP
jgi:formylglycine-generating enzyme required for sulfatase activity